MTFAEAIVRFQGQRRGDGWMAHCPAHEDKQPSLSIAERDEGRILLHCHAGCTFDAVPGRWDSPSRTSAPIEHGDNEGIAARDRYRDERRASVLRGAARTEGLRQRRADGEWTMSGVRRVLYRLPELQDEVTV